MAQDKAKKESSDESWALKESVSSTHGDSRQKDTKFTSRLFAQDILNTSLHFIFVMR